MVHSRHIAAVAVNHNTSAYMELLLRSLFGTHADLPNLSLTILDNASEDDTSALRTYAARVGVPFVPSGFTTHTKHNSHGEILRRFVLDHPDASYYLFLDADAVFSQRNAIHTLVDELNAAPDDVFAVGARIAYPWTPADEVPPENRPNLYERRLHPFCALFRNTPLFQRVAEHIGFSCVRYLWAEREQYLDTCELMTIVMRTFGLRSLRSSVLVGHFFAVSYDLYGEGYLQHRAQHRDELLRQWRAQETPDRQSSAPAALQVGEGDQP